MGILDWILLHRPGMMQDCGNRLEVSHESGEHSTLWKQAGHQFPDALQGVNDCYSRYDGIDLFSSTFKLASVKYPQKADNVRLTFTLIEFEKETKALNCSFPNGAIPFMYQAGIGYYAVDPTSGRIYEWDADGGGLSDEFDSIESVLNEWLAAVA